MGQWFNRFAVGCARFTGRPAMLLIAIGLCLLAAGSLVTGNDHLIAGSSLAISCLTLLLLPVLQATQDRDDAALHAKLDELIKATATARNALIGLENRTQEEIEQVRACEEAEAER